MSDDALARTDAPSKPKRSKTEVHMWLIRRAIDSMMFDESLSLRARTQALTQVSQDVEALLRAFKPE